MKNLSSNTLVEDEEVIEEVFSQSDESEIEPTFGENAMVVLNKRYLIKDDQGNVVETPKEMLVRIATCVAKGERRFKRGAAQCRRYSKEFYDLMATKKFMPNSPTLMNAGKANGQLSACFVLPVPDSIDGIFEAVKNAAMIHKTGGGTGFSFSRLRPKNSCVKSTHGVASGPVSFMKVFNAATDAIKQGGCFVGKTLVATADGPIPIKDLKSGTMVYAWDQGFVLRPCTSSWKTKQNTEVWKLVTDKGLVVYATPDHPFLKRSARKTEEHEFIKLKDLKPGMPLMPLTRYIKDGSWVISLHDANDTRVEEHDWMALELGLTGENIHHRDGNHLNNVSTNLEGLSNSDHKKLHNKKALNEGSHAFLHLSDEARAKAIESWKRWYQALTSQERNEYWKKVGEAKSCWNKKRVQDGTHSLVADPPMRDPVLKLLAKKSRIATTVWKVMEAGFDPTESTWDDAVSNIGLYNTQRYTREHILEVFGSWNNMKSYVGERNHRVISVAFSHYEDVYNVEVPGVHNYVVCDENRRGVVVSNTRRGANMGILRVDHPDVLEFIACKADMISITNFNISVALTDKFMEALKANSEYDLIDPRTGQAAGSLKAKAVFDVITENAWKNGDPGVIFIDQINRDNPVPSIGVIESTNPCGEQPLQEYEACNLGSINLVAFLKKTKADHTTKEFSVVDEDSYTSRNLLADGTCWVVDFDALKTATATAVRILDDVLAVSEVPIPQITDMVKNGNRKIGLGVMGFADLLFMLGIPYNTQEAVRMGELLMSCIQASAHSASVDLAKERGAFPNFDSSVFVDPLHPWYTGNDKRRNATVTTIAPTGTISMIAECSSGIEPLFAICFHKKVLDGEELVELHPFFQQVAHAKGFFSDELMRKIAKSGTVQDVLELPEEVRSVFITAHDVSPTWHVEHQAAFQRCCENAVSKTVNFPFSATVDDVRNVYMLAHEKGCKGVTIYRDGSRQVQILNVGTGGGKAADSGRPKSLPCEVHHTTIKSIRYYVAVGKFNNLPYEVFTGMNHDKEGDIIIPKTVGEGKIVKIKSGHYVLSVKENEEYVLTNGHSDPTADALTRMISLALQSGAEIADIVHKLEKTKGDLACFARVLGRTLKKYIPDGSVIKNEACPECGGVLIRESGCHVCKKCGHSACM